MKSKGLNEGSDCCEHGVPNLCECKRCDEHMLEIIDGISRVKSAWKSKIKRSNERREVEARKPYADD